jgi:uncharacterized protein (DUF1800 family)
MMKSSKVGARIGGLSLMLWIGWMAAAIASPADPKTLHLLNRLSFGARPGEVEKVTAMGRDRYIQQQLNPESIPEPSTLATRLAELETLEMTPPELVQQFRPRAIPAQKPLAQTPDAQMPDAQMPNAQMPNAQPDLGAPTAKPAQKPNRMFARNTLQQTIEARLLRATESDRQLQELMVDFWFNHFNVFSGKGLTRVWVGAYEQSAIRPHAFGRFRDLLEATARHPAMLFYLDNWQNTAPNSPGAKGRYQGLNENYARELMELHTLGVDGGYTQKDVVALAKILTGWGFRRGGQASRDNGFYFDSKRHDFSDKRFLGRTIKGSGMAEVEQALDILAKHPATARHISYQLAQYFVADQPPKTLVDRLAQRFQATDGNIREVLSTLFKSPEFWDSRYYNAKFKTPYQYVVSALRATGIEMGNPQSVQNTLQQLGMPLYGCPTPDGYKNTREAWLNPNGLTQRLNFATTLTTKLTDPKPQLQLSATLGDRFSPQTKQAIAASPPNLRSALILGSPEFMQR